MRLEDKLAYYLTEEGDAYFYYKGYEVPEYLLDYVYANEVEENINGI